MCKKIMLNVYVTIDEAADLNEEQVRDLVQDQVDTIDHFGVLQADVRYHRTFPKVENEHEKFMRSYVGKKKSIGELMVENDRMMELSEKQGMAALRKIGQR